MSVVETRTALLAALVIAVAAAACGGGAVATLRPASPSPGTPGGAGATGTPAQPTASAAQPTGGQGISNFCLNTPDEVASALGVPAPSASGAENPGFGGGCLYTAADGSLVWSIGIVPLTAAGDPIAAALQTEGAVAISGIGDSAVLVSAQGPLVFKRGTWIVSSGGTPALAIASDAAAYRAAMETLARAAATRI